MSVLATVPASFLLVDDDPMMERTLRRPLEKLGSLIAVDTCAGGIEACHAQHWTGLIVDLRLSDGSGLDVVRQASRFPMSAIPLSSRRRGFGAACIFTAHPGDEVRDAARALGADFIPKQGSIVNMIRWFARRAIASEFLDSPAALLVADFTSLYELPTMQVRMVALQVAQVLRERWPELLSITTNTVDSHVRKLLDTMRPHVASARRPSLDLLCRPLSHAALTTDRQRTRDFLVVSGGA